MEENAWVNRVFCKSSESLADIPDCAVHACITSPPYFSLRQYGSDGQIGLEPTLDEYVARLVSVFREVRRVLRDDGTLWLNLGDSWAGSRCGPKTDSVVGRHVSQDAEYIGVKRGFVPESMKPKDQMLVPHTVAAALRADGWYLRDTIVWHKPNCMPASVRDRTTTAHEYVFLLTKSPRYFYDQDAIREPLAESSVKRLAQNIDAQDGSEAYGKTNGAMKAVGTRGPRFGGAKGCDDNPTYSGNSWEPKRRASILSKPPGQSMVSRHGDSFIGANARSVWTIAPAKYAGDHYAVMPRELARRCILAGCPPGGIVLDPFAGTGTTLEVAVGTGRLFVGYELNPTYCDLITDRMGLFS